MEKEYNLRPLWDAILDIYVEIEKICKRHDLNFYVTGGTALGALRHQGFIPWDDDFDIIMPRPDYIKFMEVYSAELPNAYKAIDFRNNKNSADGFGKVYEMRDNIVKRVMGLSNLELSQGIFIDVIPIDGMPKSAIPFYWWQIRRMAWRKKGNLKLEPIFTRPFWWMLTIFMRIPKDNQQRRVNFERWLSKWNFYTSPAAEDYNASPRRRLARAFTKETYGKAKWVVFDKLMVPVPQNTMLFMKMLFGDWKQLPPKEKRVPSHQIKKN